MKKTEQTNFRVEVFPEDGHWRRKSVQEQRKDCDWIIDEIRRHVDGIGRIDEACDTLDTCSHCGARWTEDSDYYNGGCCDADQEAQDARLSAAAARQQEQPASPAQEKP